MSEKILTQRCAPFYKLQAFDSKNTPFSCTLRTPAGFYVPLLDLSEKLLTQRCFLHVPCPHLLHLETPRNFPKCLANFRTAAWVLIFGARKKSRTTPLPWTPPLGNIRETQRPARRKYTSMRFPSSSSRPKSC